MDYPTPHIPLSPVLSGSGLHLSAAAANDGLPPSILDHKNLLYVTSGRAAIALALEHSGIAAGDEVLIPAYHCESMVSPVRWRKADPVFYKINGDTSLNFTDLVSKISDRTMAIIITHFFGFLQDTKPVAELCEKKGIIVIEDCAHAFFGSRQGHTVGSLGDYAIASSMKFFPVYDGGILAANKKVLGSINLDSPSQLFQVKSALNAVQAAISYQRLGRTGRVLSYISAAADKLWKLVKKLRRGEQAGIHGPSSSGGGYGLDEAWIHRRSSLFSIWTIAHMRKDRIVALRRKNYLKLNNAFRNLPGSRPLMTQLPSGTAPLVFPLYVDRPERHFADLKRAGVPIWRFGEYLDEAITPDVCCNSVDLSAHVFQFPCHQELTETELDWMIATVTRALTEEKGLE